MRFSGLLVLYFLFQDLLAQEVSDKYKPTSPIQISRCSFLDNPALMDINDILIGLHLKQYFDIASFDEIAFSIFRKFKHLSSGMHFTYQSEYSIGYFETSIPVNVEIYKHLFLGAGWSSRYFFNPTELDSEYELKYMVGVASKLNALLTIHASIRSNFNSKLKRLSTYATGLRVDAPKNITWEFLLSFQSFGYAQSTLGIEIRIPNKYCFSTGIRSNPWSYSAGIQFWVRRYSIDLEIAHFPIPGSVKRTSILTAW